MELGTLSPNMSDISSTDAGTCALRLCSLPVSSMQTLWKSESEAEELMSERAGDLAPERSDIPEPDERCGFESSSALCDPSCEPETPFSPPSDFRTLRRYLARAFWNQTWMGWSRILICVTYVICSHAQSFQRTEM